MSFDPFDGLNDDQSTSVPTPEPTSITAQKAAKVANATSNIKARFDPAAALKKLQDEQLRIARNDLAWSKYTSAEAVGRYNDAIQEESKQWISDPYAFANPGKNALANIGITLAKTPFSAAEGIKGTAQEAEFREVYNNIDEDLRPYLAWVWQGEDIQKRLDQVDYLVAKEGMDPLRAARYRVQLQSEMESHKKGKPELSKEQLARLDSPYHSNKGAKGPYGSAIDLTAHEDQRTPRQLMQDAVHLAQSKSGEGSISEWFQEKKSTSDLDQASDAAAESEGAAKAGEHAENLVNAYQDGDYARMPAELGKTLLNAGKAAAAGAKANLPGALTYVGEEVAESLGVPGPGRLIKAGMSQAAIAAQEVVGNSSEAFLDKIAQGSGFSDEELDTQLKGLLTSVALEAIPDIGAFAVARGLSKDAVAALRKRVTDIAKGGSDKLPTKAAKALLTGAKTTGAVAADTLSEAASSINEQTLIQGHTDLDRVNYDKVGGAAAMGAMVGGGMVGTAATAKAVTSSPKALKATVDMAFGDKELSGSDVKKAAAGGEGLQSFADTTQKGYTPLREAQAYAARNAAEDVSEKEKEANKRKVGAVAGSLANKAEELQIAMKGLERTLNGKKPETPEQKALYESAKAKYKEKRKELKEVRKQAAAVNRVLKGMDAGDDFKLNVNEEIAKAIATGDTSKLTNTESPHYSLAVAAYAERGAYEYLAEKNAAINKDSSTEVRKNRLTKAEVEAKRVKALQSIRSLIDKEEIKVGNLTAQLAAMEPSDDPEKERELVIQRNALKEKIETSNKRINYASTQYAELNGTAAVDKSAFETAQQADNASGTTGNTSEVRKTTMRVLDSAYNDPDMMDDALIASTLEKGILTETERTFLKSFQTHRASYEKATTMEKVHESIMVGNEKQAGIRTAKALVRVAFREGNLGKAVKVVADLKKRAEKQVRKAALARRVYDYRTNHKTEKFEDWPEAFQKDYNELVNDFSMDIKTSNEGYRTLVEAVEMEAEALRDAVAFLDQQVTGKKAIKEGVTAYNKQKKADAKNKTKPVEEQTLKEVDPNDLTAVRKAATRPVQTDTVAEKPTLAPEKAEGTKKLKYAHTLLKELGDDLLDGLFTAHKVDKEAGEHFKNGELDLIEDKAAHKALNNVYDSVVADIKEAVENEDEDLLATFPAWAVDQIKEAAEPSLLDYLKYESSKEQADVEKADQKRIEANAEQGTSLMGFNEANDVKAGTGQANLPPGTKQVSAKMGDGNPDARSMEDVDVDNLFPEQGTTPSETTTDSQETTDTDAAPSLGGFVADAGLETKKAEPEKTGPQPTKNVRESDEPIGVALLNRLKEESQPFVLKLVNKWREYRGTSPLTSSEEDQTFLTTNQVAKNLKMVTKGNKEDGDFLSILTAVPNLYNALIEDKNIVLEFLDQEALSPQQEAVLDAFLAFHEDMSPLLDLITDKDSFSIERLENRHKRYYSYLMAINEDLNGESSLEALPEDVKTAMIASMFSYIYTSAGQTIYADQKTMNSRMGFTQNANLPSALYNILRNIGPSKDSVIASLGKTAVSNIGLKGDKNSPRNHLTQLETSLGMLAYAAMVEAQLLSVTPVKGDKLVKAAGAYGSQMEEFKGMNLSFVTPRLAVVVRENGTLALGMDKNLQAIAEVNQDTNSLFSRLFDVQYQPETPELSENGEVPKGKQEAPTRVKNSKQHVPAAGQVAIEKAQAVEQVVVADVQDSLDHLSEGFMEEIMGVVGDTSRMSSADRAAAEGKNDGILRDLGHYRDFLKTLKQSVNGLKTAFHFPYTMWVMQRFGQGTVLSTQQSSNLRFMIGPKSWEGDIPMDRNNVVHGFWRMAVAQSFGVKIENLRKEKSFAQLDAILEKDEFKAALDGMKLLLTKGDSLSEADRLKASRAIAAFTSAEEGMHSYAGLVSYARYELAGPNATTFKSSLPLEIDGRTNGVAIASIQLGGAENVTALTGSLAKMGIFPDETDIAEWLEAAGNHDAYQETMHDAAVKLMPQTVDWQEKDEKTGELVSVPVDPKRKAALEALLGFTGELVKFIGEPHFNEEGVQDGMEISAITKDGRNLTKTPLMITVYGSSEKNVKEGVASVIEEKFYNKITKALQMETPEQTNEALADIVSDFNTTIAINKGGVNARNQLDRDDLLDADAARTFVLSPAQERALKDAASSLLGEPIAQSISERYSLFLDRRAALNSSINFSFHIFHEAFKVAVEKRTEQLHKAKKLNRNYEDLPESEIDKIVELLLPLSPVVHTPSSAKSGNLHEAISMTKREMHKATGDSRYVQSMGSTSGLIRSIRTEAGHSTAGEPTVKTRTNTRAKSIESAGSKPVFTAPGVRAVIFLIQSIDASVAQEVLAEMEALGVHDGFFIDPANAEAVGKLLDKAFLRINQEYSITTEVLNTLTRNLDAFIDFKKKYGVEADLEKQIVESFFKEMSAGEKRMLGFNPKSKSRPTFDSLKQRIVDRTREINKDVNALKDALFEQGLFGNQYSLPGTTVDSKGDLSVSTDNPEVAEQIARGNAISQAVNSRKNVKRLGSEYNTLGKLIKGVRNKLDNQFMGRQEPVHRKVVHAVLDNLETLFGEAKVHTRLIHHKDEKALRKAWEEIVQAGGFERSYEDFKKVGGTTFFHKDGTAEVVIISHKAMDYEEALAHEAIHIATALVAAMAKRAREKPEKDRTTAEQKAIAIMEDLEDLLSVSQAHYAKLSDAEKDNLGPAVKYGLTNLDEFTSMALSNEAFQTYLRGVQEGVKNTSATFTGMITNAFTNFVSTVAGLVGLKLRTAGEYNAFERILTTGSALFSVAGEITSAAYKSEQADLKSSLKGTQKGAHNLPDFDPGKSATGLFESLGNAGTHTTDPTNEAYLRSTLSQLLDKVGGPMGSAITALRERMGDGTTQYINHIKDGTAPFVSKLASGPFNLSNQELYVAEHIEAVVQFGLGQFGESRDQVRRLYEKAQRTLTPEDFLPAGVSATGNPRAMEKAQAQWDFLFNPETVRTSNKNYQIVGKNSAYAYSDYLERFTALGIVNPQLRDLLHGISTEWEYAGTPGKGIGGFLEKTWQRLLDLVHKLTTGTRKQTDVAGSLDKLMMNLAGIQDRANRAEHKRTGIMVLDKGNAAIRGTAQLLRKAANSSVVRNSQQATVRAAGTAVRAMADGTLGETVDVLREVIARNTEGRLNWAGKLYNEVWNTKEYKVPFLHLLRHANRDVEQQRNMTARHYKDAVKGVLGGATDAQEISLNRVVIRSDLKTLLSSYKLAGISRLLSGKDAIKKAIEREKANLKAISGKDYDLYVNQSNALGYFLATREVKTPFLQKNAHNIAHMIGLNPKAPAHAKEATAIIDRLATLYALSYQDTADLKATKELLDADLKARKDTNAVNFLMGMQTELEKESAKLLFGNNPILMEKGYTKTILNPHKDFVVAPVEEEGALAQKGYVRSKLPIPVDPTDPTKRQDLYMYMSDAGGLAPTVSGIMSRTARRHSGTDMSNMRLVNGDVAGEVVRKKDIRKVMQQRKAAIARMSQKPMDIKKQQSYMAPVLDGNGNIHNFAYLMRDSSLDDVMDRDNRVSHVLGGIAGSIIDKDETKKVNNKLVDLFHEDYVAGYELDKHKFIELSADSPHEDIREIFKIMPEEMRHYMKEKWDGKKIYVRDDLLDIAFGYRKFNAGDLWDSPKDQHNFVVRGMMIALEGVFGADVVRKVTHSHNAWQELIRTVKDVIVIRTGVTLVNNTISNLLLLTFGSGVPIPHALRDYKEGYEGILRFLKDRDRLQELEIQLRVGATSDKRQIQQMKGEVAKLKHEMTVNPVRKLVDAGLFQTIVEDVDLDNDDYSYKSAMESRLEDMTQGINPEVKGLLNVAAINKGTSVYQFLSRQTQVSDFVARYVLHKHMMKTQGRTRSEMDIIQDVSERFVNYDDPTSRELQALNDSGFAWFSKYFLRTQRVILRSVRDEPARALSLLMLQQYAIGDWADITDSSVLSAGPLHPLGLPFGTILDAPGEIATAQSVDGML